MGEENYPNLEKICRLCLQEKKCLIDIFPRSSDNQVSIPMRIMSCVSLEVQSNDGMPKTICRECRYQLEKSYYFRKRSQISDSKLKKHIRLLGVGKKSHVFEQSDDDDCDELELEDARIFLQEKDELREKQQNAVWNETLQTELRKKIAEAKEGWTKECKDILRAEVQAELRSTLVSELRESLRSELEKELREKIRFECTEIAKVELREEVIDECRNIERRELLNDLEGYIKSKREASDKVKDHHTFTGKPVTNQVMKSDRVNKRSLLTVTTKKTKLQRLDISLPTKTTSLITSEVDHKFQVSVPFETVAIEANDDGNETEAEQNFIIVDTENVNEDEGEVSLNLTTESRGNSTRVEYLDDEMDTQNFRLQASEKNCPDPISDSYHIENSGEIQYYKKSEHTTSEGDASNEAATEDDDNNVIVFNFENEMDGENVESMEFMSLTKKYVLMKPNDVEVVTPETAIEEQENTDSLIARCNGNTLSQTVNDVDVLPARNTDTPKTFKCSLCPMAFSTQNVLDRHMRTHKKMETLGVAYQCPECFIYVSCKSALKRHSVLHTGQRPYVCEECGKSFVQREILKRHKQIHKDVKAHKCPHCARTFTQKTSLTSHINRVHAEVPVLRKHSCHLCPKSFNHASGLSRHLVTHTGLTYQCMKCNRKFADRSSIKRHIVIVHSAGRELEGRIDKSTSEMQSEEAVKSDDDTEYKYYQEENSEIII